jgi:hypothetical protein
MRLLLVALIALGLFIFGCAQQTVQQAGETKYVCADGKTTVTNASLCPPVTTTTATVRTLTLEEELSICIDMPSTQQGSFEDICYMMLAAKHTNATLCKKVSTSMRLQCYTTLVEVKDDVEVCAGAGTYKDQCYSQYAMNVGNSSICDKITESSSRDSCYSNLAGKGSQPALCDKISNVNQKDNCYFQVAMQSGDSSYCNKITSSSQKDNCLQNLQQRQAQK